MKSSYSSSSLSQSIDSNGNIAKTIPVEMEYLNKKGMRDLLVHITTKPNPSRGESYHLIELKDDDDLSFLYEFKITELDFQRLKTQFNLCFPFEKFPTVFAQDLDAVPTEQTAELHIHDTENKASFTLLKKYPTRVVVLYKLEFQRPDDTHIIEYLRQEATKWKSKALSKTAESAEQSTLIGNLQEQTADLEKRLLTQESSSKSILSETKQQMAQEHHEEIQKLKEEHSKIETELHDQIAQLQGTQLSLEKEIADLKSQIRIMDREKVELQSQLDSTGKELATLKQQSGDATQEHGALNTRFADLQAQHSALRERYLSLQEQVNERTTHIKELKEKFALARSQTQDKEAQIKELQQRYKHLQGVHQANVKELKKGNEYMERFEQQRNEMVQEITSLQEQLEEAEQTISEWKTKNDDKDMKV